jgi:1A family penicillin-binding protein
MRTDELLKSWRPALATTRRVVGRHAYLFATGVFLIALGSWTLAGWSLWLAHDLASGLPDKQELSRIGNMSQATTLLDASDRPAFTIFKEQRIDVPVSQVSPNLVNAIIAIEDQRFYDHRGIDPLRVVAAAYANLRQGRAAQGGSTLTQQLARQSFLTRDKTFRRKLKEAVLAAWIERIYKKEEILELYLNKVYFGDGLYGIEAAARGYFDRHAADLTIPEAALLAGLVKSPSTYAPTVSPSRALARRNLVLQAMLDTGAIDHDAWTLAVATPLKITDGLRQQEPYGQYFKELVRLELVNRFGWERVYQGGLRVYTTLDLDLQRAAEDVVETSLEEIEARRLARLRTRGTTGTTDEVSPDSNRLQGALIALDPQTGYVRALIGGRDFKESPFNRATQAKRQPGSAFKPFVYAAAIEAGYSPASLIDRLDEPVQTLEGAWMPEDEHSTEQAMTLRSALRTSSNRAAVRLLEDVGIDQTVEYARRLGVGSLPSVPSLALGSGEVTLESMASAYAAFANGGLVRTPVFIRRVTDRDGNVLLEDHAEPTRAIAETTAFLVSSMLADVVNYGTAYRARAVGFTLPAGGKTGTTNDFVDAWFVGFTPKLLTGVWVGFDQPQTIQSNGYAGDLAVPLWGRFMKIATKNDKPEWFKPPAGIVTVDVCRRSGKRPAEGCYNAEVVSKTGEVQRKSLVYTEYFVRGTEPFEECPLHPGRSIIDRIAGFFHGREEPVPTPVAEVANKPVAVATTASAPEHQEPGQKADEQPKKKRSFWSRLFRRKDRDTGRDNEEKKADKPKP